MNCMRLWNLCGAQELESWVLPMTMQVTKAKTSKFGSLKMGSYMPFPIFSLPPSPRKLLDILQFPVTSDIATVGLALSGYLTVDLRA